jgi:hypothetical protein
MTDGKGSNTVIIVPYNIRAAAKALYHGFQETSSAENNHS